MSFIIRKILQEHVKIPKARFLLERVFNALFYCMHRLRKLHQEETNFLLWSYSIVVVVVVNSMSSTHVYRITFIPRLSSASAMPSWMSKHWETHICSFSVTFWDFFYVDIFSFFSQQHMFIGSKGRWLTLSHVVQWISLGVGRFYNKKRFQAS